MQFARVCVLRKSCLLASPKTISTEVKQFKRNYQCRGAGGQAHVVHSDWPMDDSEADFTVEKEEITYQRYLTLFNRRVKFPARQNGKQEVHEFDVVGHPRANFHFCVTFPFHPAAQGAEAQVTLLREYAQGVNKLAYSLPAGAFDPGKHSTHERCAQAELSEEGAPTSIFSRVVLMQALLGGGRWVRLLEPSHPGVPEVKWCANRFTPFLCIDPQLEQQPGERDQEEFIQVLQVGIPELRKLMRSGDMMLPSVATCYWALDELAYQGFL